MIQDQRVDSQRPLQGWLKEMPERDGNSTKQLNSKVKQGDTYLLKDIQHGDGGNLQRCIESRQGKENIENEMSECEVDMSEPQQQLGKYKKLFNKMRQRKSPRKLREMQKREENSQGKSRKMQEGEENSQRQLRQMQEREENSQGKSRKMQEGEENSQRQWRQMQEREENLHRQLTEVHQHEENSQS